MTLNEAIEHCKEIIKSNECEKCREQHKQLLEWLKELKRLRKKGGKLNVD